MRDRMAKAIWEASDPDNCLWEALVEEDGPHGETVEWYRGIARIVLGYIHESKKR